MQTLRPYHTPAESSSVSYPEPRCLIGTLEFERLDQEVNKMLKEGATVGMGKRYSLEGCLGRLVNSSDTSLVIQSHKTTLQIPAGTCFAGLLGFEGSQGLP